MHNGQGLQQKSAKQKTDIEKPPDEESLSQSCDEGGNSEENPQTSEQLNQPSTSHFIPHDSQPQKIQPGHFQVGTLQFQPFMPAPGSQGMMIPGPAMGLPAVRMPHYSYMRVEDLKNQQGNYQIMHNGQGLQQPSKEPDVEKPPDEESLSQSCDEGGNSEENPQTSEQLNQPSTSHFIPHDSQPQKIQPGHFQFHTLQFQPFMPAPGSQGMMIPGPAMGLPAVRMPHYSYMRVEDLKNQQGNYQIMHNGQGLQQPSKEPDIEKPPDEESLSQSCDEGGNSEENPQTSEQLNQPSTSHFIPHDSQPQKIQPGHFQVGTLQFQPFMPAPGSQGMMIPGPAMGLPAGGIYIIHI
ncbi:uncharacterized protein [Macrobrachium rosenbergii]|uniref:uncharacterized protein n=1 Tax=Macrobrachium rosenbergii TaxID=79674 RepID=UPI0034D7A6CC